MLFYFILLAAGFVLLYIGAEWLVKGSASLSRRLSVSPLIIGITIVAFGTSAPELVIGILSSIAERSMIAVGNAIGSNICNTTLVLGAAALIMPVPVDKYIIRRDFPLMFAISCFLAILFLNATISRIEGGFLFAGIIAYIGFNYNVSAHQHTEQVDKTIDISRTVQKVAVIESGLWQGVFIVAGIIMVITGAQVLIESAIVIMESFGISEKFIGLTIVTIGTSLPEMATSLVAAMRKEMDISIGNLVGSNVFNILSVIGATALVRPIIIPEGVMQSGMIIDLAVMLLAMIIAWLLMKKDYTLHRSGGAILVVMYLTYIVYLINNTT